MKMGKVYVKAYVLEFDAFHVKENSQECRNYIQSSKWFCLTVTRRGVGGNRPQIRFSLCNAKTVSSRKLKR